MASLKSSQVEGFDSDKLSLHLQGYFKQFSGFFLFLISYIFISDQNFSAKSTRNGNESFSFLWEFKGSHK